MNVSIKQPLGYDLIEYHNDANKIIYTLLTLKGGQCAFWWLDYILASTEIKKQSASKHTSGTPGVIAHVSTLTCAETRIQKL